MTEYKTTWHHLRDDEPVPDPVPPKGPGWRLVCMACTDHRVYWSWQRNEQPAKPCKGVPGNPCGAVAKMPDGTCPGCGRQRNNS